MPVSEAIDETSQALTMQEAMVISLQATRDELKKTDKRIEATLSNLASNPNAVLDKKLVYETTQVSELSRADLEELRALVDLVDGQVGVASFALDGASAPSLAVGLSATPDNSSEIVATEDRETSVSRSTYADGTVERSTSM